MRPTLDVYVKKIHEDAVLPEYQTEGAAGFDFHAYLSENEYERQVPIVIPPMKRALFRTGLAMELPEGAELMVRPRSGLALKNGIYAHIGTIDSDYRGEIGVILFNLGEEPFVVKHGDRIAQGVVDYLPKVNFIVKDELSETERGANGFGSTGV